MRLKPLLVVALASVPGVAFAVPQNTNGGYEGIQSSAQRVVMQHRAEQHRNLSARTERILNGIPGNPGAVVVQDIYRGPNPRPGGALIPIGVNRTLPWAAVTRAAVKGLPFVSTALAVKELMDLIRCKEGPGASGVQCDYGVPQANLWQWCGNLRDGTNIRFCSPTAATAAVRITQSSNPGVGWTRTIGTVSCVQLDAWTTDCTLQVRLCQPAIAGSCPGSWGSGVIRLERRNELGCAADLQLGPDGVCFNPTNPNYSEAPSNGPASAGARGEAHGNKARAPDIVGDLLRNDVPADHQAPGVMQGPEIVPGERTTTQNPGGSITVRDRDFPMSYDETGYSWYERIRSQEVPAGMPLPPLPAPGAPGPGATLPPVLPGQPPGGQAPAPEGPKECGSPGRPPCSINEQGTPPQAAPLPNPDVVLLPLFGQPDTADPAWSWSFSLPTACSVIQVGNFAGHALQLDMCRWQPMIHSIMTLVWLMTTIMACIALVTRTLQGS